MLPTTVLLMAAALVAGAEIQERDDGAKPTATETSSGSAATHTVAVGAEGFTYSPQEIKAPVGDIIEFRFYPGGHTVVRADFGKYPCIPYEYTGVNRVGFFSGPKSPQVISNNLPSFQVRVNDTEPVFFYCSAPTSCIEHFMIGVINPNSNQTLDKQLEFAKDTPYQLAPGDPFPTEMSKPTPTPSSGTSSSSTNNSKNDEGGGHHLSAGAIAGIAIGGAALLILAGGLIYLCGWRAKGASRPRSTQSLPPPSMADGKFSPSPSSPGPAMGAAPRYSMPPGNDPYRTQSPSHVYSPSPSTIDPSSHPAYGHYPDQRQSTAHSPLMGTDVAQGFPFYHNERSGPIPELAQEQVPPVELPASGNTGSEAQYRPGGKS